MSAIPEVIRTQAEVTATAIQAVVKGKDSPDTTWKEVVEVAKVVDVLELVVVVVTGGCEVLGTLVVEAVLVLTEVPASRALSMAV